MHISDIMDTVVSISTPSHSETYICYAFKYIKGKHQVTQNSDTKKDKLRAQLAQTPHMELIISSPSLYNSNV